MVQGESQADLDVDDSGNNGRLIKPKRTFSLSLLRCLGAFTQIGLYAYLASRKLDDENNSEPGPGLPPIGGGGNGTHFSMGTGPRLLGREINEEWPLWLPVMHGIIWV